MRIFLQNKLEQNQLSESLVNLDTVQNSEKNLASLKINFQVDQLKFGKLSTIAISSGYGGRGRGLGWLTDLKNFLETPFLKAKFTKKCLKTPFWPFYQVGLYGSLGELRKSI